MNSSKFLPVALLAIALIVGFAPRVLIAADAAPAPAAPETSKVISEMKDEIKKLRDEVEKLKKELDDRKANAQQKRDAKAAAKKQKELQEANAPAPGH